MRSEGRCFLLRARGFRFSAWNNSLQTPVKLLMETKLQLYRKQQMRGDKRRRRRTRLSVEARTREEVRLYGKQGPASPVRRIDPATGRITEIIPARTLTEKKKLQ
jgi:hypothetical protein